MKRWYYVIEGLNAFATSLYFSYLFFYMESRFGFGDLQNLGLSALNGLVYMATAWFGGRFGQRRGYFRALRLGFGLMGGTLALGPWAGSAWLHLVLMSVWTFGLCFTWPNLEALVSEGETGATLPRRIGIYNLTWAGGAALAYFVGGALIEHLGMTSLFVLPLGIHALQWGLVTWLQQGAAVGRHPHSPGAGSPEPEPPRTEAGRARLFLRLAWLANPFSYMAVNTLLAVIPGLARRHDLSPTWAGVFCSIWWFARMGSFLLLWQWPGWHYRFRWFVGGYVLLIASFTTILVSPMLWLVLAAQLAFGLACGLMYYSSLFYSMDVGDTKGEHGGIHESAIGAGVFAGPAVGAMGLWLLPHQPQAGAWAVSALLLLGLAACWVVRRRATPGRG